MAITYGFYNSVGRDRRYNADHMSQLFDGIINDGVFASVGTSMVVEAAGGMVVNVGVGRAWFNRTWTNNDALFPVTIPTAELTNTRIDAVVIEVNKNEAVRANAIKVVKGGVTKPELQQGDGVFQYPLAYVTVAAGTTDISQLSIENCVGTEECPFVTGILQTMTIEGITTLLEAQWNEWFDNVKDQLGDDVAGNLQLQINALGSEIDEKFDEAEKTVYDEARSELVHIRSEIDVLGVSPLTVYLNNQDVPSSTPSAPDNAQTFPTSTESYFAVNEEATTMYMVGRRRFNTGTAHTSPILWKIDLSTLQENSPKTVVHDFNESTATSQGTNVSFKPVISNDGNVVRISFSRTNGVSDYFLDINTEHVKGHPNRTVGSSDTGEAFATENYWGGLFAPDYNRRYIRIAQRGTDVYTSYNLPNGASNAARVQVVGVHGDFMYYLIQITRQEWQLGRINCDTGAMTNGLETYTGPSIGWTNSPLRFIHIFSNDQYGYFLVTLTPSGTQASARALKIDLTTGTSNWSSEFPPTSLAFYSMFSLGSVSYIGTIGEHAYAISPNVGTDSEHYLLKIEKTSGDISGSFLQEKGVFGGDAMSSELLIKTFPFGKNKIPFANYIIDVENSSATPMADRYLRKLSGNTITELKTGPRERAGYLTFLGKSLNQIKVLSLLDYSVSHSHTTPNPMMERFFLGVNPSLKAYVSPIKEV